MSPAPSRAPVVPTIASLSPSQQDAIRRIPAHDKIVYRAIEASRPASIFLDPAHFGREQERVFRKFAVPVMVSALLPNGHVLANDNYGVPLVATRARDGKARLFLNACQHKGAKLVEDNMLHKQPVLVCPYHAWSYGLDGKLVGVPHQEAFLNLCKSKKNLIELPTLDAGGILWAHLDPAAAPDFGHVTDELVADLDGLNLRGMHVYGRQTFDLRANWKLVFEPFMEGYHVQRLHAQSVGPLFADVPTVTDRIGMHFRQVSGKVDFDPERHLDPEGNIHKHVTHAYQLFPNAVVITSPYYISVMVLAPRAADRTIVDYVMLTHSPPDNPKAQKLYERSYQMVLDVFGGEDFRAAQSSHAGLASGGLDELVYCGLEEVIPSFYDNLEACLR